ncbi:MAG TPA: cytochrome c [Acidobacteriaceae bacterium]|nr:cytochrome c [Acidobacteriaceae bacterium]
MRLRFLPVLTACSALLAMGCNSSQGPVARGAAPATPTTVGPVPGGVSEPEVHLNPYGNDPVAIQDGRRLFDWYNCSGCHGGHAGGGMGPSLRDKVWRYGSRDDQIFDSIAEGRSMGMPSWGKKIPDAQIWQLVAYIKSMRTLQEADPPNEPANEQTPNPEHNDRIMVGTQPAP